MVWAQVVRVSAAFIYGVLLGVMWECASMIVLLSATLVEHVAGTLCMMTIFVGIVAYAFLVAAQADLARPLLSIFFFRLSAQIAMTIGTGSLLLTTMLSDTPSCTSDRLRASGWRGLLIALTRKVLPRRLLRRVVGVEPPFGPPFLRVLAAVASREWLSWVPMFGRLPSLLSLPGSITFRPDRAIATANAEGRPARLELSVLDSIIPINLGTEQLYGVYTYACKDQHYHDYYYIFRYPAFWYGPASMELLRSIASLCLKMLLMHAYASLFMLLSQANCREAFGAELERRADKLRRWIKPRPPVRLIPIEPGDICAFCHEELIKPPDEDADAEAQPSSALMWGMLGTTLGKTLPVATAAAAAAVAAALKRRMARGIGAPSDSSSGTGDGTGDGNAAADDGPASSRAASTPLASEPPSSAQLERFVLHCRWGCGKAVHRACATGWGRNSCVYCAAPMS